MALCRGHRVGRIGRDHFCRKTWVAGEPVVADCIQERGDSGGSEASVGELDVVGIEIVSKDKVGLAGQVDR